MKKKRFSKQRSKHPFTKKRRKKDSSHLDPRVLMADHVLEFLAAQDDFIGLGEIIVGMKLPRHDRKHVKDILITLEKKGETETPRQ